MIFIFSNMEVIFIRIHRNLRLFYVSKKQNFQSMIRLKEEHYFSCLNVFSDGQPTRNTRLSQSLLRTYSQISHYFKTCWL